MRRIVLVPAAAMTACLFPDLSGLSGSAGDASPDVADASSDVAPSPPTEIDLGLGFVSALAVDAKSLYFMSSSLGGLFSIDKTNGGNQVHVSGDTAYGLRVDANNFYWRTGTDVVQRAFGNAAANVSDLTWSTVTDFAIDTTSVYATVGGTDGAIVRAPIGGGPTTTLTKVPYPGTIAVDATRVYFTTGATIQTVPLAGGNPNVLVQDRGTPDTMVLRGTTVFWVDLGSGTYPDFPSSRVQSIDESGAPLTQKALTGAEYTITSLVADDANLYFSVWGPPSQDDSGNPTHPNGEIHRVPLAGGADTVVATNQSGPQFLCLDDAYVYWVDQDDGTIQRLPK